MPDRRHTILIVDDEPGILESLVLSLEDDYEVVTAENGEAGLARLAQCTPALIISDQRMPGMMGVEFLEKARDLSPDSVRMMLTGFSDFDAIVQAINKGNVYRYISKPWEPADLQMDVGRAVEAYELKTSLDRRMRELEALCEIGSAITSVLDSEQVMDKILNGVVNTLGFDRSLFLTVDAGANMLRFAGAAGVDEDVRGVMEGLEYDLDREDVGVVLTVKEDRPILVEDVDAPPANLDTSMAKQVGIRSFVTAPLRAGDHRIGVLVADRSGAGERVTAHDQRLLMGFADQAAIALENARLYEEAVEKKLLEEEVNVAARIQARLLPESMPDVDGFELSAMSRPSRGVGGDYYDVVSGDDGSVWIAVGDVSGKGIPAALTMATLRTLFRTELDRGEGLPEMMRRIGQGLFIATAPEVFATFWFGTLDPATRSLRYVNAGHPFPTLARSAGDTVALDGAGMPIGFDPILGVQPYVEQSVELAQGDVLVICSDGIPEAGASNNDMFGEERLEQEVSRTRANGAVAVMEGLCSAVETFTNSAPADDDLTIVVVKRNEGSDQRET